MNPRIFQIGLFHFFFLVGGLFVTAQEVVSWFNSEREIEVEEFIEIPISVTSSDQPVTLTFDARINFPTVAGSNYGILIWLDGQILKESHLVNKGIQGKVASGGVFDYYQAGLWRAFYSPSFDLNILANSSADYRVTTPQPYRYSFQLGNLEKGQHLIRIKNALTKSLAESLGRSIPIVIANLNVSSQATLYPKGIQKRISYYNYFEKETISIAPGSSSSVTFSLTESQKVLLSFYSKIDFPNLAGFNYSMMVKVDGNLVQISSLRNKGEWAKSGSGTLWNLSNSSRYLCSYSPNFSDALNLNSEKSYQLLFVDPYYFEFDLGQLGSGSHTIEISNVLPTSLATQLGQSLNISLKNILIKRYLSGKNTNQEIYQDQVFSQIPPEKSREWNFVVNDNNKDVFLKLKSWVDYPSLAGWAYGMKVELDGVVLNAAALLSRSGQSASTVSGTNVNWYNGGSWLTMYSLNSTSALESSASNDYRFLNEDPYWFELSLGKLSLGVHKIKITNQIPNSFVASYGRPFHLMLQDLRIGHQPVLQHRMELLSTIPLNENFSSKLLMKARTDYPSLAGWNYGLGLKLNSVDFSSSSREDVGSNAVLGNGQSYSWAQNGGWLNAYSPDYSSALSANAPSEYKLKDNANPYQFKYNIGNLVSNVKISIQNLISRITSENLLLEPIPLVVESSEVQSSFKINPEESKTIQFIAPLGTGEVLVSLWSRVDFSVLAGTTAGLGIEINGKTLSASDLINKPRELIMRNGVNTDWFSRGKWTTLYSPNFTAAADQSDGAPDRSVLNAQPYHYVFRLGNLGSGTHSLKVLNYVGKDLVSALGQPLFLEIKNLSIYRGVVNNVASESDRLPVGKVTFSNYNSITASVQVSPGKQMEISYLGNTIGVQSLIQYDGGKIQWDVNGSSSSAGWNFTSSVNNSGNTVIEGATTGYVFRREIIKKNHSIQLIDTFTNNSGAEKGLSIDHFTLKNYVKGETLWVNGLKQYLRNGALSGGENPSVFLSQGKNSPGFAFLAEDDVFRVHCQTYANSTQLGIKDNNLAIPNGGSYQQTWSIYFTSGSDYYEFVNRYRQSENIPFTISGTFLEKDIGNLRATDIQKIISDSGAESIMIPQPEINDRSKVAYGLALLNDSSETINRIKAQAATIRSASPSTGVLTYFDTFLNSGAESGESGYSDSRTLKADGTQALYSGWGYRVSIFHGTPTNNWGKNVILQTVDLYTNTMKTGVFWDQITFAGVKKSYGTTWDGYSAELDSSFKILRKYSDVALMTQSGASSLYVAVANRVKNAGYAVVGNSQPVTKAMSDLKFTRFTETGIRSDLGKAHLHCPLGLANWRSESTEADVAYNIRRNLDYGCLYHYFITSLTGDHIIKKMYPIKPMQIFEGYVIGTEKMITNRSGEYSFGDSRTLTTSIYDEFGKRIQDYPVKNVSSGGITSVSFDLPSKGMAIIEGRLP